MFSAIIEEFLGIKDFNGFSNYHSITSQFAKKSILVCKQPLSAFISTMFQGNILSLWTIFCCEFDR